jgi:hypothetical protein
MLLSKTAANLKKILNHSVKIKLFIPMFIFAANKDNLSYCFVFFGKIIVVVSEKWFTFAATEKRLLVP